MTIRRRLTLSFFAILCLLGLNLVIYFWSDIKRKSTFEEMRSAISRQILISSVQQDLSAFRSRSPCSARSRPTPDRAAAPPPKTSPSSTRASI